MTFEISLTSRAKEDIERNFDWWAINRSKLQAEEWYLQLSVVLQSLTQTPNRCRRIRNDRELFGEEVRQLLFGTGSRPTHRIVFGVDGTQVMIYRVLHTSQSPLASKSELKDPS